MFFYGCCFIVLISLLLRLLLALNAFPEAVYTFYAQNDPLTLYIFHLPYAPSIPRPSPIYNFGKRTLRN